MRFTQKIIGPDEKLIGISNVHWIYGMRGLIWLAVLMSFGMWLQNFVNSAIGSFASNRSTEIIGILTEYVFWIMTGVGAVIFLFYFLMMVATEIGLTSKRIIYKTGFIFVKVKEEDLEEIKAAEINHGLLGRIFNYGYIYLDARFIQNVSLPAIGSPYRFLKALNEARSNLRQDSMTVVVEGQGQAQNATVQQQAEEPAHKLEEKRYAGSEETPMQAARAVVGEAGESLKPVTVEAGPPVQAPAAEKKKKRFVPQLFRKKALKERIKMNFEDIATHTSP